MAVAVVDVQVKGSGAARELGKVDQQAKKLEASVKGVGRSTASATANVQRFGIAFDLSWGRLSPLLAQLIWQVAV